MVKLAIIADAVQREELLGAVSSQAVNITYIESPQLIEDAGFYVDLLFDDTTARIEQWNKLRSVPVILNAVNMVPSGFARINGWPGCLKAGTLEVAGPPELKEAIIELFALLGKKVEWVPNIPGFIFPRIISMIINEAHFALEERITDESAIDVAMRLGTNYPLGPFEWGARIGWKNIFSLLSVLAKEDSRYKPSKLLAAKAG
jgi:3-hydroxybutyryl-CoA dehydrogenase